MALALALTGAAHAEDPGWSVLLLTVDCLRPDHMGAYGYERDTTPYLSSLTDESVFFDNAFSTSAWTSPGIVSLLTGYFPPTHGQNSSHSWFDEEMVAPLEVLAKGRFRPSGRSIDGATMAQLGMRFGQAPFASLEEVVDFYTEHDTRFFAWVHIKEPHLPYDPSPYALRRWGGDKRQSPGIDAVSKHGVVLRDHHDTYPYPHLHPGEVALVDADTPTIRALYDGTVSDVDDRIGRVMERMRDTGLLDRTVVIITADHGEELMEHGWVGHASTSWDGKLTDELIHIPLIIRTPNGTAGRVDQLVQQVDVLPTLFEMMDQSPSGLDAPMQGVSLLPLMRGADTSWDRTVVFAQTTPKGWTTPRDEVDQRLTAARTRDLKLIRHPNGEFTGFDLSSDPTETTDVHDAQRFAALHEALDAWDTESTGAARALLLAAARRRTQGIRSAIEDDRLDVAIAHYRGLVVMRQTWEMETAFDDPGFTRAFTRETRTAGRLLTAAIRAHAQ
jgi:arylsulfatase A-like enzyme